MKIRITLKGIGILLLLALLGAGLWYYYFIRTPEYLIKKQIQAIAEDINKNPQETNSIMTFKMVSLANRLSQHVEVSVHGIPIGGGLSGGELASQVSRARMAMGVIDLKPVEIYVTLLDDTHARAECELIVKAHGKEIEYRIDEVYHLRLMLERNSAKKWVFTGFHESQYMEK